MEGASDPESSSADSSFCEEEEDGSSESLLSDSSSAPSSKIPVILPRRRYAGHCNIETVRDGIDLHLLVEIISDMQNLSELHWSRGRIRCFWFR